jgi:hypothetical protein
MLDENSQEVISMCTQAICSLNDPRKVKIGLEKLINPLLSNSNRNLKLLSYVFSSIDSLRTSTTNPLPAIFNKLFPVLIKILANCQSIDIIESIGIILKNSMRCMGESLAPYLSALIACIEKNFESTGISNYLYYAEFTVSVYGPCAESFELFLPMIDSLGKITFDLIHSHKSNNEQLISDFLGLCLRCIECSPRSFFGSQIFMDAIRLSISMLDTKDTECKKTVNLFLLSLFNCLKNKESLNDTKEIEVWDLLLSKAEKIIKTLFKDLTEEQGEIEYLVDLLIKMYITLPINYVCCFLDALKAVI